MSEGHDEQKVYVIKKVKKIKKGGHHGGAWKIAYADFVTAMMTFFLLMWLLSLLNKYELAGIAEYFRRPFVAAFPEKTYKRDEQNAKKRPDNEADKEILDKKMLGISDHQKNQTEEKKRNLNRDEIERMRHLNGNEKEQKLHEASTQKESIKNLEELKQQLVKDLENNKELSQFKNQLNFIVTAEGLKIQLHDLEGKPMFSTGRTDFKAYAEKIMSWLSKELNTYPNQVEIIGNTDGQQYQSTSYTNWELSADRANAARRALIDSGMEPQKIVRVIGNADVDLYDKANPLNPANRRIEIIVLSNDAMKKVKEDDAPVPIQTPVQTPVKGPLQTPNTAAKSAPTTPPVNAAPPITINPATTPDTTQPASDPLSEFIGVTAPASKLKPISSNILSNP